MSSTIVLHFWLLVFNFLASVIQGITGFGDAVLLQVVWFAASEVAPHIFNQTALGDSPVRAVTLLMYCRIIFAAPVLAYLSLHDGIFSLHMTIAMAVPSTLSALAGIFIFKGADNNALTLVLGASSLAFAALYVAILATKYVLRRRKIQRLQMQANGPSSGATAIVILPESEAAEADSRASGRDRGRRDAVALAATTEGTDAAGRPSPTFLSATTGSPFTRREASPRLVTESANGREQPPLTPSKVSPSNTILYTRVRVNRNLDSEGHIKISTKMGASCAAALSGAMGSLTGVGAPPQIIFVLLFDVPAYIIRVNFAMQSIPSAALRFIVACTTGMFTKPMIPLFFTSVVGGYGGLVAGVMLGKVLGPNSYSIFVLSLLLISSMIMLNPSVIVLTLFTAVCAILTVAVALYERRQIAEKVTAQKERDAPRALREMEESSDTARQGALPAFPSRFTPPLSRLTAGASGEENGTHASFSSDAALSGHGSTATMGSSVRTNGRVRRADLKRPPPLWNDKGEPVAPPSPTPPSPHSLRPPKAVTGVAAPVQTAPRVVLGTNVVASGTAVKTSATVSSSPRPHGMCEEDVKRWVETQEEEILLHPS